MSKRISVLSVPIDCITMDEAVSKIIEMTKQSGLHLVATANAEMVMLANQDPVLHGILNSASLVVPDGAGILWAAERMGESVPERVTGVDITKELFKKAASNQIPVYCLGAAPGVAQRIIKDIEASGAKLVFVALGVPKQEQWISEKLSSLQGVVAIGIGGSFDVLAGNIPRAPHWMQRNRLEWLYRLYLEPKRIGRMLAIPRFMWTVIKNK